MVTTLGAAYASDWDTFGKIAAGMEGMRILTGGEVDIVGTITGMKYRNRDTYARAPEHHHHYYTRVYHEPSSRVWVPHTVWKKKWVPRHKEYDPELGEIIVEGHYIKYQVEQGGHWEYTGRPRYKPNRRDYSWRRY